MDQEPKKKPLKIVLSLVALSCGNLIRHWIHQPMVNIMIYSFIEIPFYEMIARIEFVKTVSVLANSEKEAREKLKNKNLIFSKKTPAHC